MGNYQDYLSISWIAGNMFLCVLIFRIRAVVVLQKEQVMLNQRPDYWSFVKMECILRDVVKIC